jgi:hypothetical protein
MDFNKSTGKPYTPTVSKGETPSFFLIWDGAMKTGRVLDLADNSNGVVGRGAPTEGGASTFGLR